MAIAVSHVTARDVTTALLPKFNQEMHGPALELLELITLKSFQLFSYDVA
jgi:hypothetical protein